MAPTWHIRTATLAAGDDKRVLAYFDSQLSWLATVGSGDQWGSETRGNDEKIQEKYRRKIERSEANMAQPYEYRPDWNRAYVIEAEADAESLSGEVKQLVDGRCVDRVTVPVAAMILETEPPEYVRSVLPEQDEADPFIYLAYLLSDRRTSSINKGAGAALIRHAKEEVKKLAIRRICGDCWRGNDRKLVQYYESQGFKAIGDFGVEEKDDWPGAVFEMRL